MKAYTIRCGECDAKLKVEKPELVGKRVKCPKCSARVLVLSREEAQAAMADTLQRPLDEPAADQSAAAGSQGSDSADDDGPTLGFSDFDDIDSLLQSQAQKEKSPRASTTSKSPESRVSTDKPTAAKRSGTKSPSKAAASDVASDAVPDTASTSSGDSKAAKPLDPNWLDPNASWQSAEVAARRRWMMIVTAASLAGVLAIAGVIWVVSEFSSGDNASREVAQDSSTEDTSAVDSPGDTSDENQSAGDPSDSSGTDNDPTSNTNDSSNTSDDSPGDSTLDPSGNMPNESEVDTNDSTPDAVSVAEPEVAPSDPLDGPPGFSDPATPSVLRPFDTVLSDLDSLGAIMVETPFDKARVLAERELSRAYRVSLGRDEVFVTKPAARDPKLAEQLALELQAIDLPEMSLEKYLELISNLTGLAIQVEPDALLATEKTLESPLVVKAELISVGDLLTQSLETLGLGWEAKGDVLLVSVVNPEAAESRKYSLEGLGEIATKNPELAAEVLRVMIDPESWSAESGNSVAVEFGDLVVVQRPLNHWRIDRFMARWREEVAAEGSSTAGDSGAAEVSATDDSDAEVARELLTKRVTLEYLQPVSLRILARDLANQVDGTILIDWLALSREGWTADTALACSLNNETLGIGLQDTLRPAALSFRVLDATTLQITTRNDLLLAADVEFFDLTGLQTAGISAEEVQGQLPLVFRAVGTADPSKTFFYDPANGVLISSLPQPKQRALAKFLSAWERFTRLAAK